MGTRDRVGTHLWRIRTFLYDLRDRALEVLSQGLAPRTPGPQAQEGTLLMDRAFIQRAISIMPLLQGTVREVQRGLELLLGIERSVGYISQILSLVGEQAEARNQTLRLSLPILGKADEIFQGRKPCLTLVDGRSFLVVNLRSAVSRDGTTWGVTWLDLVKRGIQVSSSVTWRVTAAAGYGLG
jgi:hypothetical protein